MTSPQTDRTDRIDADRRAKLEVLAMSERQIAAATIMRDRLLAELSGQPCGCDPGAGHVCERHGAQTTAAQQGSSDPLGRPGRLTTQDIVAALTGKDRDA